MRCPKCKHILIQTKYLEFPNGSTRWFFWCDECDKTYVILGEVVHDDRYDVHVSSGSSGVAVTQPVLIPAEKMGAH